ncbi:MAG: hypothetical protein AAF485_13785 [Chloroflexota bacterium]
MSVGHVARLLEDVGIATVIISAQAFRPRLEVMTLPRLLLTPHVMGRPVGAPHDQARQRETLLAALDLLETAQAAGTIVELGGSYRP